MVKLPSEAFEVINRNVSLALTKGYIAFLQIRCLG